MYIRVLIIAVNILLIIQRWALIRKRHGNSNLGNGNKTSSSTRSEERLAAQKAFSLAVDMPMTGSLSAIFSGSSTTLSLCAINTVYYLHSFVLFDTQRIAVVYSPLDDLVSLIDCLYNIISISQPSFYFFFQNLTFFAGGSVFFSLYDLLELLKPSQS